MTHVRPRHLAPLLAGALAAALAAGGITLAAAPASAAEPNHPYLTVTNSDTSDFPAGGSFDPHGGTFADLQAALTNSTDPDIAVNITGLNCGTGVNLQPWIANRIVATAGDVYKLSAPASAIRTSSQLSTVTTGDLIYAGPATGFTGLLTAGVPNADLHVLFPSIPWFTPNGIQATGNTLSGLWSADPAAVAASQTTSGNPYLTAGTYTLGVTCTTNLDRPIWDSSNKLLPLAAWSYITFDADGNWTVSPDAPAAPTVATSTVVSASPASPAEHGSSVTLTATITPASGTLPTGATVTFKDNGAVVGTGLVGAGGIATLGPVTPADGAHSFTASYPGDTGFDASDSDALAYTVNAAPADAGNGGGQQQTPPPAPVVTTLTTATPVISGTVRVGSKLTVKPGTWGPGTVSKKFQWFASGKAIKGATKSTFTLTGAQFKKKITVKVTGSEAGFTPASVASKASKAVAAGKLKAATPKIAGAAKVGKKLTAKPGTWTKGTKFSFQWYAGSKAIKGATKSTFKVAKAEAGKTIKVKVTGKLTGYTNLAKVSKTTKKTAK